MTHLEKQLDAHSRANALCIMKWILILKAFIGATQTATAFALTRVSCVQHEPSDGYVAVSQAVQELWDVVQNHLLP